MADTTSGSKMVDLDVLLAEGSSDPMADALSPVVEQTSDPVKPTEQKVEPTEPTTVVEGSTEDDGVEKVELELDKDGNLVDAAGKIVFNKDVIKYDKEGNLIVPVNTPDVAAEFNQLFNDTLGINYDGKLDEVTPDSVRSFLQGAVDTIANTVPKAVVSGLIQEYPDLQRALTHLQVHGNLSTFNNAVIAQNYTLPSVTDVSDAAAVSRKAVVVADLEQTFGIENATTDEQVVAIRNRAKSMADMLDAAGKLTEEATAAHNRMVDRDRAVMESADLINQKKLEAQRASDAAYWNDLKTTLRKRDLGGVVIPEHEVTEFERYLTEVDKDGLTAEQRAVESEGVATALQVAYLRFKKFNLEALVNAAKKTDEVKKLQSQKQYIIKRNSRAANPANHGGVYEEDSLTLSNLLT